ncbi:glycosyltransferase family 2 protein [Spirosoma pollinicola]|uniref:Glycosyl transferase family 2 n=1 Tax=Spirosoma pollinicola TaxID=2057025 RepID=A0A2K8Z7A4_9BACT|nr:glycosyltransferase family 2 protein [Spirosoma pollinicola]AUD05753.1 glycosyl transferase family 2 [Spirosoma pollinicola]
MRLFTIPEWVQKHTQFAGKGSTISANELQSLKANLQQFSVSDPEVSIVIPAYNEEENILQTLSSLACLKTSYRTELIVANNNSADRTQELLDLCGVQSVFVADQGISYARQAGLDKARGTYIVSADADSLYPPDWLDALVTPLKQPNIACSYGTYSFIPSDNKARFPLGLHELTSETFKKIKRKNREFVDVMGFNFAYRKADGLAVGGFRHDLDRKATGRSEDGWMAYCLSQKGALHRVSSSNARAWTGDRRLMESGSLGKAYLFRVKKEMKRLNLYFTRKGVVKPL